MALSSIKTFVAGEPLFASDLNGLNTNILNNGLSLISPLTGTLDASSQQILDVLALGLNNTGAPSTTGRLQMDGIALKFYDGVRAQAIQTTLSLNIGSVGNVGAGNDGLMSFVVEAGFWATASRMIAIEAGFLFAANANTKTLRFQLGSTNAALNTVTTAPNNRVAIARLFVYRTGTDAQSVRGSFAMSNNADPMFTMDATESEAGAPAALFTGESGSSTTNDIIQSFMAVTLIR